MGQVLRDAREALGLSQEQMGFQADLHRTYVGQGERGERNLSLIALERWIQALGLTWEEVGRRLDQVPSRDRPSRRARRRASDHSGRQGPHA